MHMQGILIRWKLNLWLAQSHLLGTHFFTCLPSKKDVILSYLETVAEWEVLMWAALDFNAYSCNKINPEFQSCWD